MLLNLSMNQSPVQPRKPPTEHMPLPEEDIAALLTKAYSKFDPPNMSTSKSGDDR